MLREIEVEENWVTGNFVPNFVTQVQRIGVDIARDRGRAGKNYITLAKPVDQPFDRPALEEVTKSDGKKTTTEFVPRTKEIIFEFLQRCQATWWCLVPQSAPTYRCQ